VTDLVTDSLQIEGFGTWVLATVVVWIGILGGTAAGAKLFGPRARPAR
jgi:hypothetical protein